MPSNSGNVGFGYLYSMIQPDVKSGVIGTHTAEMHVGVLPPLRVHAIYRHVLVLQVAVHVLRRKCLGSAGRTWPLVHAYTELLLCVLGRKYWSKAAGLDAG